MAIEGEIQDERKGPTPEQLNDALSKAYASSDALGRMWAGRLRFARVGDRDLDRLRGLWIQASLLSEAVYQYLREVEERGRQDISES